MDPYLTPFTKINSKGMVGLNVGDIIIKLLDQTMVVYFCDLGLGSGFLDKVFQKPCIRSWFLKSTSNTRKTDKVDLIKMKNFGNSSGTSKKVKRPSTKRRKIFAGHVSDKKLLYRIYKGLIQLNKKTNNSG